MSTLSVDKTWILDKTWIFFWFGTLQVSYDETEYIHRFLVKSYRLVCSFRIVVGLMVHELCPSEVLDILHCFSYAIFI